MKILCSLVLLCSTLVWGDCAEVAAKYRTDLTLPYHDFTDLGLRNCLGRLTPDRENLHAFVALAFYDNSLRVRQDALEKLEAYSCKAQGTCDELHGLLEGHLKATALAQSSTVVYRAEHLRDRVAKGKLQAPVNLCEAPALQAAQTLARQNKRSEKVVKSSVTSDGTLYTIDLEGERYEVLTSGDSKCHVSGVNERPMPK